MCNIDRFLFVWLYRLYPSLLDAIIIVQPETVICWLCLPKTISGIPPGFPSWEKSGRESWSQAQCIATDDPLLKGNLGLTI